MRADGDVDPRMTLRLHCDGVDGLGVVGVDANEEVVIAVSDGRQIVLQHAADNGVLAPQRDEDGDGALRRPPHRGVRWPGEAQAAGRQPDQGDKQVIQAADHDPHRHGHQQGRNPVIQALK